ncbi:hypothetical protein AgCh_001546 [Apium graveolens]
MANWRTSKNTADQGLPNVHNPEKRHGKSPLEYTEKKVNFPIRQIGEEKIDLQLSEEKKISIDEVTKHWFLLDRDLYQAISKGGRDFDGIHPCIQRASSPEYTQKHPQERYGSNSNGPKSNSPQLPDRKDMLTDALQGNDKAISLALVSIDEAEKFLKALEESFFENTKLNANFAHNPNFKETKSPAPISPTTHKQPSAKTTPSPQPQTK